MAPAVAGSIPVSHPIPFRSQLQTGISAGFPEALQGLFTYVKYVEPGAEGLSGPFEKFSESGTIAECFRAPARGRGKGAAKISIGKAGLEIRAAQELV